MKLKLLAFSLLFLAVPVKVSAQEITILTEAASVRETPGSDRIVKTLNLNDREELLSRFHFWGKGKDGWINLDYTDFNQPIFITTGSIKLKLIITESPQKGITSSGKEEVIPEKSVLIVAKEEENGTAVIWKGIPYLIVNSQQLPQEYNLKVAVTTVPIKLKKSNGTESKRLKEGTPFLLTEENVVIYKGKLWSIVEEPPCQEKPKIQEIIDRINTLINIFNSAKLSSPIAERLGYYPRLLPVESKDIKVITTTNGKTGVRVVLKYHLFTKNGNPINFRRTRLIFKKANFEFWKKVTETFFKNGVNKFVELDIARFDPEEGFSVEGFIASSYHLFKSGKLASTESFIENSESELSEDLWFFADEVYERIENGD